MAFTRKFLSALGIEADKVDEIITAHTEVTDALKAERDSYKENAEKLPAVQKELDELKKTNAGDETLRTKYDELKKEFDDYKAEIDSKNTTAKKEKALRGLLKKIGVPEKRHDAIIKVSDVNSIELDDDGNIKDGEKHEEAYKTEWSDFIPTTRTEGATVANPPANAGKTTMTKDQIRAISDPVQRQKAMIDNPSLFGLSDDSND